jgi:hypothetical protein
MYAARTHAANRYAGPVLTPLLPGGASIVTLAYYDLAAVRVTITWPGLTSVTLSRVGASGAIVNVRNAEPATLDANGEWIGFDYEPPLDEDFYYLATSTESPGTVLLGEVMRLPSQGLTWLRHPGRPAFNRSFTVTRGPDLSRPAELGVFNVLSRSRPIAVSSLRQSERGVLDLRTDTDEEATDLLALVSDGTTLLFAPPSGYGLPSLLYLAVADVAEVRVTGYGPEPTRYWSLPFTVVDRPAGAALASGNSWSDLLGGYTSWLNAQYGEGTWTGVLEGVG